ncbi:hypothetical protein GCN74_04890 [Janthinobacterium sp. FT14W]|uniref:hypothetical protein n=1 Tax=Janthinobacterium sp. FT14W TaxID=2654253 RepID=UPI001265872D|nr:hypothetical protein [Janthinobacterium sp. FT14W]KAB8061411.1 hypothetical protein GCN74_04890 [Janthinobacterium sp. FT14W]
MKFHVRLALPIVLSVAGCGGMLPTPKDQAAQIDFGASYMNSLTEKYQPADQSTGPKLRQRLEEYDALEGVDLDTDARKNDALARAQANADIRSLTSDLQAIDAETARYLSFKAIEENRLASLEKEILALNRKASPPDAQIAAAQDRIDARKTKLSDIASTLKKLESDKSLQSLIIEEKKSVINRIDGKTYDTSEAKRKIIRNGIVRDFMAIADHNYLQFKNDLLAGRVRSDTAADISELLLSTATTLTGGLMAKSNLGAASTLLKGSRATVDKNFFAQQTMRAIINSMEVGRSSDKTVINSKMTQSTDTYPISEAISDVQRYQSRASLFLAVLDLANQSGKSAASLEDNLNDAAIKAATSGAHQ